MKSNSIGLGWARYTEGRLGKAQRECQTLRLEPYEEAFDAVARLSQTQIDLITCRCCPQRIDRWQSRAS